MTRSGLLRLTLTAVLLIPAVGGSSFAYVCEMDGKIHRECCCDHGAPNSDCVRLEKRGCCEIRPADSQAATQSTKRATGYPAPVSTVASTVIVSASLGAKRSPDHYPAFAAYGPPIFLRNCSLLH